MKITSLLFTALMLSAAGLQAQDDKKPVGDPPPRPERGGGRGPGGGPPSIEDRLKRLTEALKLTQEQQDKIKAIFEKNEATFKEIISKGRDKMTDEDRKKMEELRKSQQEAIDAVLTDEQKAKMKEMRPGGAGGSGGPGGPGGRGGRGRGQGGSGGAPGGPGGPPPGDPPPPPPAKPEAK